MNAVEILTHVNDVITTPIPSNDVLFGTAEYVCSQAYTLEDQRIASMQIERLQYLQDFYSKDYNNEFFDLQSSLRTRMLTPAND